MMEQDSHPDRTAQTVSPPGCKLIRTQVHERSAGLWSRLAHRSGIDFEAKWVQEHIARCPRCQRRFARRGRVMLALALLKAQTHSLGLLALANTEAIRVLQRPLRDDPKARILKTAFPEPTILDKVRQVRGSLTQMAACLAVMALGKVSMSSSILNVQQRSQQAMHQYYAHRVGEDLAEEVFPT